MNLICPRCMEEATIRMDVVDAELVCTACDETYTVSQVKSTVDEWAKVLPRLEAFARASASFAACGDEATAEAA